MALIFHSCPVLLKPGSTILPGNYGRIIRAIGEAHPLHNREAVLEQVRAEHFPDKPSRLDACFGCSSLEAARFYVRAMSQKAGGLATWPVIYEVEKTDPHAVEHRADFNVVQPLPRYSADMSKIAHLYWTAGLWITVSDAPGIRCEEIVTPSPLRILRKIDE
jgi:hypothetical protein